MRLPSEEALSQAPDTKAARALKPHPPQSKTLARSRECVAVQRCNVRGEPA